MLFRSDAPPPEPGSIEAPERPAKPAPGSSGGLWETLIERFKDHVSPMYQYMLDDAHGALEGDVLVVRCGDELTRESLEGSEAAQEIQRLTAEHLGRSVRVQFVVGAAGESPAGASAPDKLEELIRRGGKYDNFVVK